MKWLKLADPTLNGPEVTLLQEILTSLGYDLGESGVDGVFGTSTADAVRQFQRRYGLISDGAVGNLETWPLFRQVLEVQVRKNPTTEPTVMFVDRRLQHAQPTRYRPDLGDSVWHGEANVIEGVILHQTGCILSDVARVYDVANAHIVVTQGGTIVLVNPLEWYFTHSGEYSSRTISVEFEGNMPGIHGDPSTVWTEGSDMHALSDSQLKAADLLFAWLKNQFEQNGGDWKHVYAHRQFSKIRQADPGSEVWQKIGLKWINALGADDGGDGFTAGDGLPIPRQWNPMYDTKY